MLKTIKSLSLLLYFVISLFYMELLLRISTSKAVFSFGLLLSLIFSFTFAAVLYCISSLFRSRLNYILSSIFLTAAALIFSSQIIYFKFFKTFYTVYSAGNTAQVMDLWRDILSITVKNIVWPLLLLLPAILLIFLGKKFLVFQSAGKVQRILVLLAAVLIQASGIASVRLGSKALYSAYDLYYENSYSLLSVERLGLLTTMRLDFQRLVFDWSPALAASAQASSTDNLDAVKEENQEGGAQYVFPRNSNIPVEYNLMNIDFDKLIQSEKNELIKNMHKYFETVEPTEKNKYTGIYKDYNLILITAEGFSPYAVREDITPTLYKLVHQGYNFTNFYNPIWGVSTSDGEYVACTGLLPKSGVWSFEKSGSNYMPFVMGNQLKSLHYKTSAYHDHSYTYYKRNISHPNMGYDYKALDHGLDLKRTWPESDLEMMEKTIPEYIKSQPFHTYYMTVSGHMLYSFSGNAMASKNRLSVQALPYSDAAKAYLASQVELDRAMEYLLNKLEEAGIANKTLIALSADHYPYGLDNKYIDELAGHTVEKNFELYKSTFILYTKGMKPVTIDKPCSSLDIIPTLSNLLGLQYDSRLLMGRDIFSNSDPLVIFLNKSFITDKGAYNSSTGVFTPSNGALINEDYRQKISSIIDNKFYYSAKILETNYYKKVLK